MRLERASEKAMKYACLNFHYAKRMPAPPRVGFSVFNDAGEWCGCVIFNNGIQGIQKPFGLKMGQVIELVRVALNGKQVTTSKCVSLAIKLFKKQNPLVKVLVSYADSDQDHFGTIYQAMNWAYVGSKKTSDEYIDPKTGKSIHSRSHSQIRLCFRQVFEIDFTFKAISKTRSKHKWRCARPPVGRWRFDPDLNAPKTAIKRQWQERQKY